MCQPATSVEVSANLIPFSRSLTAVSSLWRNHKRMEQLIGHYLKRRP